MAKTAKTDPKWPITSRYIRPEVQDVGLNVSTVLVGWAVDVPWPTGFHRIHPSFICKIQTRDLWHGPQRTCNIESACQAPGGVSAAQIWADEFSEIPVLSSPVKAKILNIGWSETIVDRKQNCRNVPPRRFVADIDKTPVPMMAAIESVALDRFSSSSCGEPKSTSENFRKVT